MIILFDLISTQGFINGGAEYTITIFSAIIERNKKINNTIIALYDSRVKIPYDFLQPSIIEVKFNISCIDIASSSLSDIIETNNIDVFFIGIGQRLNGYSLEKINCKVICVIHDLFQKEIEDIKLHQYLKINSWIDLTKDFFHNWKKKILKPIQVPVYNNLINFVKNDNVELITVSEYSKFSLLYYYQKLNKEIKVLYSPEKKIIVKQDIENLILRSIIDQKKKYFLIVSADRELKNAEIVINVFEKFSKNHPDLYLLTIGYPESKSKNHLVLPYLSASDLEISLMYSYAMIYPSLFEGFGYPPIEAMKYSKPVLSSNVCSMPEILGDAPIFFSPIYKVDIFKALHKVLISYDEYANKSKNRYLKISQLQQQSLNQIVDMILEKSIK